MRNSHPNSLGTPTTDRQLWHSFRLGSRAAYGQIYRRQFAFLLGYGRKLCRDHDTVGDCIQDLFQYLWEHRQGLGDTDNIRRYLCTSLRRRIFQRLRQHTNSELTEPALSVPSHETTWIDQQTADGHAEYPFRALHALPARQKEAVLLKYYQNMTSAEIALEMNIRRRAVYKLLTKAIGNMRGAWVMRRGEQVLVANLAASA